MPEKNYGIPYVDPMPLPTPEHQRKIMRGKRFEVVAVIALIVVGFGYLAWRDDRFHLWPDPARSISESIKAVEAAGNKPTGSEVLFEKTFRSFEQPIDGFVLHTDLVGTAPESPLETAVFWLTPLPGQAVPPQETILKAVNAVGQLAQELLPASVGAFEKAANTMELINDTPRPHEKGAAGTSDSWKVTYITYRAYDEHAEPQPVLYYVLQRLSAGAEDAQGTLNRELYEAVKQGVEIKAALKAAAAPAKPGSSGIEFVAK